MGLATHWGTGWLCVLVGCMINKSYWTRLMDTTSTRPLTTHPPITLEVTTGPHSLLSVINETKV